MKEEVPLAKVSPGYSSVCDSEIYNDHRGLCLKAQNGFSMTVILKETKARLLIMCIEMVTKKQTNKNQLPMEI